MVSSSAQEATSGSKSLDNLSPFFEINGKNFDSEQMDTFMRFFSCFRDAAVKMSRSSCVHRHRQFETFFIHLNKLQRFIHFRKVKLRAVPKPLLQLSRSAKHCVASLPSELAVLKAIRVIEVANRK